MKSLLQLVVLLVGVAAGWFGGSWSGRHAKEALAKVEATGQALQAEHQKQVDDLNARMGTLTSDYTRDKAAQDQAHTEQVKVMDALLTGVKGRVAELEKARNDSVAKLQQLKAQRDTAATPQARHALDTQIAAQESSIARQAVSIQGEQCLSTPVPSQVLASWNGGQP